MAYVYSSDALVKPPVLFGRRLLPFTLGHADVLNAMEHPALTDQEVSIPDLASAIWICSTPWKTAAALISSDRFANQLSAMGIRARKGKDKDAAILFAEYRDFYITGPPRWEDKEPTVSRVPWHLTLFCAIQKNTNLSMNETWNLTVRRAAEICAGLSELNGDKSLMTPEEQNFIDRSEP